MNFNVFMWPHLNAIYIAVHQLSVLLYLRNLQQKTEKTSTAKKNQNKEAKEEKTSPTEVGC